MILASEFRYRKQVLDKNTAAIFVSQSGETADTLAALKEAKEKGTLTLGIVNAVGSSVARETDAGVYNHAGPEIAVASTKASTSQMAVLALISFIFRKTKRYGFSDGSENCQRAFQNSRISEKSLRSCPSGSRNRRKIQTI